MLADGESYAATSKWALRVSGTAGQRVPETLERAPAEQPRLEHRWESLTAGRRRTLVYPVERAKLPATRAKRVQAILEELGATED